MSGLGSTLPPASCEGRGTGRFASKAHSDWLKMESTRLVAIFGIAPDDAMGIARQFRNYPEQRRAKDLLNHAALTLRTRQRFLSRRGKAAA